MPLHQERGGAIGRIEKIAFRPQHKKHSAPPNNRIRVTTRGLLEFFCASDIAAGLRLGRVMIERR